MSQLPPKKIDPCLRPATVVDRFNKPLVCLRGHSYRPDIWIQPNLNCPRFLSYRCTPCKCNNKPICAGPNRRRIRRWSTEFIIDPTSRGGGWWCCKPEFECTTSTNPSAPRPGICNSCVCPHGGDPGSPDPEGSWDAPGLLNPPSPCPNPPVCRLPKKLISLGIGTNGCRTYLCVDVTNCPNTTCLPGTYLDQQNGCRCEPVGGDGCGRPGLPPCMPCLVAPCPANPRFADIPIN